MEPGVSVAKPSDRPSGNEEPASSVPECPLGGLVVLMRSQLTAATKHVGTCQPCQMELLSHGGIVPPASRRLMAVAPHAGEGGGTTITSG
jgi:hypothetical protein